MINAQDWLKEKYPNVKNRKTITELNFPRMQIHGHLNLTDFINLKKLVCNGNQLSDFDLSNSKSLIKIWCIKNNLSKLDLSKCENLFMVNCGDNKLSTIILSKSVEHV